MKIRDWARQIFYPFLQGSDRWVMSLVPANSVSILMYHTIAPKPPEFTVGAYPVKTPQQFEQDLIALTRFASPARVPHQNDARNLQQPRFILTFDDGLSGCYHYAFPLLKKYGIRAVFFINPAFTDNRRLFYRYKANILLQEFLSRTSAQQTDIHKKIKAQSLPEIKHPQELKWWLKKAGHADEHVLNELAGLLEWDEKAFLATAQPYMSRKMLLEMQENGMIIGAHSMTHPLYSEISLEEQVAETEQSLEYVKSLPGCEHLLFAFPFTADGASPDLYSSISEHLRPEAMFGTGGVGSQGPLHQRFSADYPQRNVLREIAFSWLYAKLKSKLRR